MAEITSTTIVKNNGESSEPVVVKSVIPIESVVQTIQTFVTKVQHSGKGAPTFVTKKIVTTLKQNGKPESSIETDEVETCKLP